MTVEDVMDKDVVEAFQDLSRVTEVLRDAPSDEEGRRGKRYTIMVDGFIDGDIEDVLTNRATELRITYPDFAWSFSSRSHVDSWPRRLVWSRHDGPAEVDVAKRAFELTGHIPEVVAATSTPPWVAPGQSANVSLICRVPMGVPPMQLAVELEKIRRESMPEEWTVQLAPELNFPPTGVVGGSGDLDDIKMHICRAVAPFRMVEGVWFRSADDEDYATVYVLGEDDELLFEAIEDDAPGVVRTVVVKQMSDVPKKAQCIFNDITRMLKAQAEGDAKEVERIRSKMSGAADAIAQKRAAGMTRGDAAGHMVPCRWCGFQIPASDNPAYNPTCPKCDAIQPATTIPTKQAAMPLISIFVNPDNTAFFEFVFAPPIQGRWDLSRVVRCTLQGSAYEQHPMGKRKP